MAIDFQPIKDFAEGLDLPSVGRYLHRVSGLPAGIEFQIYRLAYQWRVKVIRSESIETWVEGFYTLDEVKAAIESRIDELQK